MLGVRDVICSGVLLEEQIWGKTNRTKGRDGVLERKRILSTSTLA